MTGCAWAGVGRLAARLSPATADRNPSRPHTRLPIMQSSLQRAALVRVPTRKIPRNSKRLVPDMGVGRNGFSTVAGMWRPVALLSQQRRQRLAVTRPADLFGEGWIAHALVAGDKNRRAVGIG